VFLIIKLEIILHPSDYLLFERFKIH